MGLKNEEKKALGKVCLGFCQTHNIKKKGGGGGVETIDESLSGPASLTRGSKHRAAGVAVPGPAPSRCSMARAQPHLPGAQEASLCEAPHFKRITSWEREHTNLSPVLRACK